MSDGRTLVTRLFLRDFRNLQQEVLEPAPRFNLIFGDNGHGKTSLIEALYVLSTTKSFRSSRLLETIAEPAETTELGAHVQRYGLQHELRARIGKRGRSFLLDGKRPKKYVDYALKTPVIAFHPGDLTLASGPASTRRTLLDRVMLYLDPAGADARVKYQKALRHRQRLLESGATGAELTAYESVIAQHGTRLTIGRHRAAEKVSERLAFSFAQMAPPELSCVVTYQAAGHENAETFARELFERRRKDLLRGAATFGPQRDELFLTVAGRPVRSHASQGQQRLVTLAMKMAELSCVRDVTDSEPLLLLDDVSSELDPERTQAVFDFLRTSESQIFVTTTRPALFENVSESGSNRADFHIQNGRIQRLTK